MLLSQGCPADTMAPADLEGEANKGTRKAENNAHGLRGMLILLASRSLGQNNINKYHTQKQAQISDSFNVLLAERLEHCRDGFLRQLSWISCPLLFAHLWNWECCTFRPKLHEKNIKINLHLWGISSSWYFYSLMFRCLLCVTYEWRWQWPLICAGLTWWLNNHLDVSQGVWKQNEPVQDPGSVVCVPTSVLPTAAWRSVSEVDLACKIGSTWYPPWGWRSYKVQDLGLVLVV